VLQSLSALLRVSVAFTTTAKESEP